MKTLFSSLITKFKSKINSIIGKKGNTRSDKVKRNAIISFIVMILTNLISFLLMPVVISYLDVTKYGIWLTINSVLAWVFLLDLGLSGGLRTRLAQALAKNAFIPNTFVDITDYIDKKIEIMKLYETEIMPDPLPRSVHAIKGLAAFRGSRIGVMYAESFQSLLEIR